MPASKQNNASDNDQRVVSGPPALAQHLTIARAKITAISSLNPNATISINWSRHLAGLRSTAGS
eukprot:720704-Lingulodinium_polyedra.AAC.1